MDGLNPSLAEVSIELPSKPYIFTFVPVVRKLPFESIVSMEERSRALTGKPHQISAASHEETATETMSDGEIFKAEKVFIADTVAKKAAHVDQTGTTLHFKLSPDHVNASQTEPPPSVSAQSENTPDHEASGTASMETAADKRRSISQRQCQHASGLSEVSSGFFANRASEDRTSPTNSADIFPTPASSRESILSDGSDKDKSWSLAQLSSVTSPASFSRTVSPCSSVLSGIFSPAVVQIKRHFLAPGSSLIHTPQTCLSSCESLSSICPQSPPARHRPPLTRLSLLTAILRKGRLPVLSPALQRPYTPCWPMNPVTLSFCNACSAASSVASIPLEFSSQFSSSVSIDSQSHVHRDPNRCVTAPPSVQANELSRARPPTQVESCSEQIQSSSTCPWGRVVSPLTARSCTTPRSPAPPMFYSNFESFSLPKREEIDCKSSKKQHISTSESPKLWPSNTHMRLKGHVDNNVKNLTSSKPVNEQQTNVPQPLTHKPNSSLSRLHSLSQRLRSPLQPSPSPSPSPSPAITRQDPASPLPHLSNTTTGRCESGTSRASTSQAFHKAHCLSPSRYTPIVFSGWPSPTGSPTPTPSPAPPIRDFTPSPSVSMRSTPSPRPGSGISDCSDREGKKRKTHKIKLSYKSLAAIPTNTLLQEQQAIDEQVEREDRSPYDTLDRGVTPDIFATDTHAEMCSPAQLRQQSEELYAVIDEVLANSIPPVSPSSRSSTPSAGLQLNNSSFPKSLGRETKYASICSLHSSSAVDRDLMDPKKTRPGIIRPMTAIPRLMVEDEEEFHPNPFRRFDAKRTLSDIATVEGRARNSQTQVFSEERKPERRTLFSVCDLQITEPEDQIADSVKHL
ncbi:uncharacterized protein V6R79_010148 [Siganus canaliculatus]